LIDVVKSAGDAAHFTTVEMEIEIRNSTYRTMKPPFAEVRFPNADLSNA
jgi:hypothetical protein